MKKTATALTLIALSLSGWENNLIAQEPQQILPLDPAIRTGKLPNGFTYYIRHNDELKHSVVMYLVNKAGSLLKANGFWLGCLASQLQNNDALDEIKTYPIVKEAVTIKDIQAMARQCLNGDNYIRLVLLPENSETVQEKATKP